MQSDLMKTPRRRVRFTRLLENVKRHGLPRACFDIVIQLAHRLFFFKIMRFIYIELPDRAYLQTDNRYQAGFLESLTLIRYCREEQYDLPDKFVRSALEKGDQCFGIRDGELLASYGWYSNVPTEISDGLILDFDKRYIYVYKGFTLTNYRGQRLLAVGITMALQEYLDRGFAGFVGYVEANNFDSLKSVYRMGYRDCGSMYIVRIFGRYLIYRSADCRLYGLCLQPSRSQPIQTTTLAPRL